MRPHFLSTTAYLGVALTQSIIKTMLLNAIVRKHEARTVLILVANQRMEEEGIEDDLGSQKVKGLMHWADGRGRRSCCIVVHSGDVGGRDPKTILG